MELIYIVIYHVIGLSQCSSEDITDFFSDDYQNLFFLCILFSRIMFNKNLARTQCDDMNMSTMEDRKQYLMMNYP